MTIQEALKNSAARESLNKIGLEYYSYFVLIILGVRVLTEGLGYGPYTLVISYGVSIPVIIQLYKINKYIFINSMLIGLLLAYGFLNIYVATSGSLSAVQGIIRYVSYLLIFLIFYSVKFNINQIIKLYGALILVQFMIWTVQSLMGMDWPSGTMYSRNHIGYFLIPYIFVNLIYYKHGWNVALSTLYAFLLGGLGAIVSIFAASAKYLIDRSFAHTLKLSFLIVPIILALTIFFLSDRIVEQVNSLSELPTRLENFQSGGTGSFTWRVVTWYYLITEVIYHEAYIFGMGLDTTASSANLFGLEPHNDYVKVFTEFGLVGLTIFLGLIYYHLRFLNKRKYKDRLSKSLYYSFIGLCIGMIVGNLLVQVSLWWFYFALLGYNLNKNT